MDKKKGIQQVYKRAGHIADLDKMRLNDELCDVTIKINEKEFRAHKVILAAGIKYFHTMFLSDFQESSQNIIRMSCVNEDNMEALISFAYTGKITLTIDNVISLLEDVDYLNVNDVKEACIGFLMQNLTSDKVLLAYKFAQSINCTELKEAATQLMSRDFKKFSRSKEYLDVESDLLKKILSEGESDKSQCYFEGIVRWLVRDIPERERHVTDLLSIISISDLTTDYLIAYLYENISQEHDAIIRNIVSFYRNSVKRQPLAIISSNSKLRLVAVNRSMLSHVQYFDFGKNEWTLCYTNVEHKQYTECTVLRNKLYIVGGRSDDRCAAAVDAYDPQMGTCNSLSPMSVARRDCAVSGSTKSKYLYVCGGRADDGSELSLVERYDIAANTWETLSSLSVERYNATAVIFQGNVYVIGGSSKGKILDSVERYSPGGKRWTTVGLLQQPRASCTATVLDDKLYVCGGKSERAETNAVEVYDPKVKKWQLVANMQKKRHSFVTVAFNGKLLAVGGDSTQSGPTVEMYDPDEDKWSLTESPSFHIKYVMGGLIQS